MANKASRVRYTGVACYADDTQLDRVQAMGSTSNLTTEDIRELGTLNIVEFVDDVPTVDINLETNEYGSNQTIALLTQQPYGCRVFAVPSDTNASTDSVRIEDGSLVTPSGHRVPFKGGVVTIPEGEYSIYALYDHNASPQYEVVDDISPAPEGAVHIADVICTAGVVTSIVDRRSDSFKTIELADFELSKTDIYVPVKQSGTGNNVARTMYMENCYVNNYSINYSVGGTASESFGLETDNKRWFLNGAPFINVDSFVATDSQETFTLTHTPVKLADGNYTLKVVKNGHVLNEGLDKDFTISGSTLSLNVPAVEGDLVKVRYISATGGRFHNQVSSTTKAGALREGMIEIYLKNEDDSLSQILRAQSVRISIPLNREQLNELGHFRPYDRPLALPIEFSVDVELRDSDLEFFLRMAGKDLESTHEVSIDDLLKNTSLFVKVYRHNDVYRKKIAGKYGEGSMHPDLQPIKEIVVENLIPTSENWDVRVDSDATQTFSFRAFTIKISC